MNKGFNAQNIKFLILCECTALVIVVAHIPWPENKKEPPSHLAENNYHEVFVNEYPSEYVIGVTPNSDANIFRKI